MISRIACGILLGAMSVDPPDEGDTVSLEGGPARFQYQHTGCGATDHNIYRVRGGYGHAAWERRDGHLSYGVEGGAEFGTAHGDSGTPDNKSTAQRYWGNAHMGGQWQHIGFELGPGFGTLPPENTPRCCETAVFMPSATLWFGDADLVYVWGSFGSAGPRTPSAFAGVGVRNPSFEVTGGIGTLLTPISAGPGLAFALSIDGKPGPKFWPGIDVRVQDAQNWSAALRLSIHFGEQ